MDDLILKKIIMNFPLYNTTQSHDPLTIFVRIEFINWNQKFLLCKNNWIEQCSLSQFSTFWQFLRPLLSLENPKQCSLFCQWNRNRYHLDFLKEQKEFIIPLKWKYEQLPEYDIWDCLFSFSLTGAYCLPNS